MQAQSSSVPVPRSCGASRCLQNTFDLTSLTQNAELFTLTYGALVVQLIKDYESYPAVNTQLDKMGYNIGCRLIDDFLARSSTSSTSLRCTDFREVGDVVAKVAFKAFLNMSPTILHPAPGSTNAGREFALVFEDNPLAEFVELPEDALGDTKDGGLWYSNVLCGVIRGALEMVRVFPSFPCPQLRQ